MKRLGLNQGKYHGATINIDEVLNEIHALASGKGLNVEKLGILESGRPLIALSNTFSPHRRTVYISSGIHGDEPAGPLSMLQILRSDLINDSHNFVLCPCLNPDGFKLNSRENPAGIDLNRDYLQPASTEVKLHKAWLSKFSRLDLCLCLHEDWESQGFYLYELNPTSQPSLAEAMVHAVSARCPIDLSPLIEGRPARGGIIRPDLDPLKRPLWPESFFLLKALTDFSYTLEAPSDFELQLRADALFTAVQAALQHWAPRSAS